MLKRFQTCLLAKAKEQKGQGMVEYSLLIGLLTLVAVGALSLLGTNVREGLYRVIADEVTAAFKSILTPTP